MIKNIYHHEKKRYGFSNHSLSDKRRHFSLQESEIRGERFGYSFHCENPEKVSCKTH
ncbi:hypothetical protein HanPSC8_Chr03g0088061 [Helianthus annuus]|nr:hypothetical protein HanPSC8_Chr03g0088061 [Helianthus annuus]